MKHKTMLTCIIMSAINLAQAQVEIKDFERAVDHLNCKAIELSLKKSPTIGVTSQFKQKCNCVENPNYTIISSAIPQTETKTKALATEINEIKTNEYKKSLMYEDVIVILTEDIFKNNDKYSKIADFAENRKTDGSFENFLTSLKIELAAFFPTISSPVLNGLGAKAGKEDNYHSTTERISAIEKQLKNINARKKTLFRRVTFEFDFISILFSLFLSILILYYVKRTINKKESKSSEKIKGIVIEKLKEINSNMLRNSSQGNSNDNSDRNNSNKINDLYKRIEILEQQINTIIDKIDGINSSVQSASTEPKTEKYVIELSEANGETFYLSIPNPDGSFQNSSASTNYKEGASIYRFTKISNSKAKYKIDEREASIKLALQYPDKNIDPVCDAENAFNPKANTITTTYDGEVELVGDRWINNKKARIRYGN